MTRSWNMIARIRISQKRMKLSKCDFRDPVVSYWRSEVYLAVRMSKEQGDIFLRLLHRSKSTGREKVVWRCQFHTCFVKNMDFVLKKQELDDAAKVDIALFSLLLIAIGSKV